MSGRVVRGILSGFLASVCAGCGSLGGAAGPPSAQVRFIQVASGAGALDTAVNGSGAAYNLGYETFTSYVPVPAGAATLRVDGAASGLEVLSSHEVLAAGRPYTVVLSHGLGSLQERIYADQDTPAPVGTVEVRIVNAVEASSPLVAHVTTANAIDAPALRTFSLPEGDASAYFALPAGATYLVTAATSAGTLSRPLKTVALKVAAGSVRTIVFAGVARAGAHPVVGFTLVDADAD